MGVPSLVPRPQSIQGRYKACPYNTRESPRPQGKTADSHKKQGWFPQPTEENRWPHTQNGGGSPA